MPYMPLPRHHPPEGHTTLLPAVRDMPLPLLRCQHQGWFPGRHGQEGTAPRQSQLGWARLDAFMDCVDLLPLPIVKKLINRIPSV